MCTLGRCKRHTNGPATAGGVMKINNINFNFVKWFVSAALAITILFSTVAAARDSQPNETAVTAVNNNFKAPALLMNTWTNNVVPSWQLLPRSAAGVWRPGSGFFSREFGSNILWINFGGVSQTLPITVQPFTDYSFSVQWGYRNDGGLGGLALQFVAGGQVLATCAPQSTQAQGEFSTVKLVYHGERRTQAFGKPLSVRIVMLSGGGNGKDNGQLDVKDAQITVTDDSRRWPNDSSREECSIHYSDDQ
jgi:hypothetical protein